MSQTANSPPVVASPVHETAVRKDSRTSPNASRGSAAASGASWGTGTLSDSRKTSARRMPDPPKREIWNPQAVAFEKAQPVQDLRNVKGTMSPEKESTPPNIADLIGTDDGVPAVHDSISAVAQSGGSTQRASGRRVSSRRGSNRYDTPKNDFGFMNGAYSARTLQVGQQSPPKQVAGAIAHISREGECPRILLTYKSVATYHAAVNQAIKGIAIARQFLATERIELCIYPDFTDQRRNTSNGEESKSTEKFTFIMRKAVKYTPNVFDETTQELKVSKDSKAFTVAGAIAGRVREGQRVVLSAIGPRAVMAAVRSIAFARQYLAEDGVDICFRPSFVNLEFDNGRKSSCLQFQILAQQV